jgi:hypothetical protein
MDFSSHSKHRIGVIWPLEYSEVAGIALFQDVSGEKANSILSYKHRIKCRIRVYFSPEIERYTMSYRAIGLIKAHHHHRRRGREQNSNSTLVPICSSHLEMGLLVSH